MACRKKDQPLIKDILTEMLNNGEFGKIMQENDYTFQYDLIRYLEAQNIATHGKYHEWKNTLNKEQLDKLDKIFMRAYETQGLKLIGAMQKNARGFEYEESEQEYTADPETGEMIPTRTRVFKRYKAPDIQSQKILMANLGRKMGDKPSTITGWTNSPEVIEVKTETDLNLKLDASVQEILKEIMNDK